MEGFMECQDDKGNITGSVEEPGDRIMRQLRLERYVKHTPEPCVETINDDDLRQKTVYSDKDIVIIKKKPTTN